MQIKYFFRTYFVIDSDKNSKTAKKGGIGYNELCKLGNFYRFSFKK